MGRELQIWESPPLESKQFQPFKLVGAFGTCHDDITCLDWSPCGEFVAAGSRDLACHIFSGRQRAGYRAPALTGHRAPLVGCFFARRGEAATLYTVSEDGALVSGAGERLLAKEACLCCGILRPVADWVVYGVAAV